ncbi:MAG TPA: SRPBCC family protein [Gemmataceae bacterium]|nr:SRPBCC family protein [Gemmataceae bacterium]
MSALFDVLYWVAIGIGCLAGVLALIALIGCFFPRGHVATRSLEINQPPDEVWQIITDFAAAPSWHPELKTAERLPDRNGNPLWRETDKRGYAMTLETVQAVPPRRLVRCIADEGGPFSGQWEFDIEPTDAGSRVTLTEKGQIPNPFFRFMFRLFMKPTWYLDMYLRALAVKMGRGDEVVLE